MWCEIQSRQWVDHHLIRCCWVSNHLTSHFVQEVSWPSSHKVLLNFWPSCITFFSESKLIWPSSYKALLNFWPSCITFHPASESTVILQGLLHFWPSCITFHPGGESTMVLQGAVEFLTILHHILSREWVDCHLARCCWIFLTIWHHISSSWWVDYRLARCCWISDHLTWHLIQRVSQLLSCKVLLHFWPSCITFHPGSELTVVLQGVVEFLTISHHILSSSWVDRGLARRCWISDHLASHFVQGVGRLWSRKVLLNFWPSCITFCPESELTVASQGVVEFLTISCHILSSWWVDHHFTRCCWIPDHLASHFVQMVCWPLFRKVLLNFWPSCITFHPDGVSTVITSCLVIFLTM